VLAAFEYLDSSLLLEVLHFILEFLDVLLVTHVHDVLLVLLALPLLSLYRPKVRSQAVILMVFQNGLVQGDVQLGRSNALSKQFVTLSVFARLRQEPALPLVQRRHLEVVREALLLSRRSNLVRMLELRLEQLELLLLLLLLSVPVLDLEQEDHLLLGRHLALAYHFRELVQGIVRIYVTDNLGLQLIKPQQGLLLLLKLGVLSYLLF